MYVCLGLVAEGSKNKRTLAEHGAYLCYLAELCSRLDLGGLFCLVWFCACVFVFCLVVFVCCVCVFCLLFVGFVFVVVSCCFCLLGLFVVSSLLLFCVVCLCF